MEPLTQEILIQLNRIDKKISKLQQELKEIKEIKNLQYSNTSSIESIDLPRSIRKRRSIILTKENEPLSTSLKEYLIELRPSRIILDQLSLLNESSPFNHTQITLSYYLTNFLIVDSQFLPYKGLYLDDKFIPTNADYLSLPFLLTDVPLFDVTSNSTSLYVNEYEWLEKIHVYTITKDNMICEIQNLRYDSRHAYSSGREKIVTISQPLTLSLTEMIGIAKIKEIPILNLKCNTNALRKDAHHQTLLMLLLRVLLYSKAKDYLLESQKDMNQDSQLLEVMKHLTRLEQSTLMINGLKISTQPYNLMLHEIGFAVEDSGDDICCLSLKRLFNHKVSYLQNNKLNPFKMIQIISEQYLHRSTMIDVEISSAMNSKPRKLQVFGVLVTEFNIHDGRNIFYFPESKEARRFKNYHEFLQEAQQNGVKYESNFHLIEMIDETGEQLHLYDYNFTCGRDDNEFHARLPEKSQITDVKLASSFRMFQPESIFRFIDLFFIYPQMLPYPTEFDREYEVEITKNGVVRVDGFAYYSHVDLLEPMRTYVGKFSMIELSLDDGFKVPALRLRISLEKNEDTILVGRYYHYHTDTPEELYTVNGAILDKFMIKADLLRCGWNFYTESGDFWSRDVSANLTFKGRNQLTIPIMTIPDGFTTCTQQYDLEHQEVVNIISSLIYRSNVQEIEIDEVKRVLSNAVNLVNHLVAAVNGLEKAFTSLSNNLQNMSQTPWWKKTLQGLVMVAGLTGSIVFPFSLPIAIGLIAGSTLVQVGLMFADGDYLTGGIQLAGVLIGLGTGYYGFREATSASYPIVNLEEARVLPLNEEIPGINTRNTDGMWIEVKPLNIINNKMEDIGKFMIKNTKGLLRTLMKFENAPVHARVRSQTTRILKGKTVRTTIVTGVTDGMPYLSHVNPRPGTYEIFEVFENDKFINGWTSENVPIGGKFENLEKSIQGLLIEGVGTNEEFKTVMRSWEHLTADERAISLNDAQDYIRRNQTMYTEMPNSRIPISFDESLVRNVSNVFAKHTGIYELIGLGAPAGPNNCQTYSKELRDFFAKGALRKNKLSNTSFLNDLMDAFDSSIQFKHIYKPGFQKRPIIDRSVIPIPIA